MRMWDTSNHRPTNLWHSVGATGMGLFQHYKAMKVETTKVPWGPGPPMTSSPDSWHSRTKRMLLWLRISESQCIRLATEMKVGTCIFWLVETRDNILTRHKAKLSAHRTRWKENLIWFYTGDLLQSMSKQMSIWWEAWTYQFLRPAWTTGL